MYPYSVSKGSVVNNVFINTGNSKLYSQDCMIYSAYISCGNEPTSYIIVTRFLFMILGKYV